MSRNILRYFEWILSRERIIIIMGIITVYDPKRIWKLTILYIFPISYLSTYLRNKLSKSVMTRPGLARPCWLITVIDTEAWEQWIISFPLKRVPALLWTACLFVLKKKILKKRRKKTRDQFFAQVLCRGWYNYINGFCVRRELYFLFVTQNYIFICFVGKRLCIERYIFS